MSEQLSKDEIFKQSCDWYLIHPDDVIQGLGHRKGIIERSMDVFAKQTAIGFVKWLNDELWVSDPFPNKHTGEIMWSKTRDTTEEKVPDKTIKQLYELYLK